MKSDYFVYDTILDAATKSSNIQDLEKLLHEHNIAFLRKPHLVEQPYYAFFHENQAYEISHVQQTVQTDKRAVYLTKVLDEVVEKGQKKEAVFQQRMEQLNKQSEKIKEQGWEKYQRPNPWELER